ncbi:hypothetical protein [Paenibacillus amylolyticus]|uniref:hypothetical protein n=1 Tax=Paenibacillus amylolyticus TaxID=1451 RepID=UPI003D996A46
MTQSSEKISQQYIDGGVIPADLTGQESVSKTYVDTQLSARDVNISAAASAANAAQNDINSHTNNSGIHVTPENKANWESKAPGTVQNTINSHIADSVAHLTANEHMKLTGIQPGAEVNQNAFSKVNDIPASSKTDTVTIKGGVGIAVTSNPNSKEVEITATGSSTPGAHGSSHAEYGADPIPVATETDGGIMSAADKKSHNNMADPPRAKYTTATAKPLPYVTWTTPNWDTKNFDTNSFVSQGNNGEIVINEAGTYLIQANISFSANPIGFRNILFEKNGSYLAYQTNNAKNDSGQIPSIRSSLSALEQCEAGDVIKISCYQDAGASEVMNINAFSTFSIIKVAGFS